MTITERIKAPLFAWAERTERLRDQLRDSELLGKLIVNEDRASDAADSSDESLGYYDRLLGEEAELCAVPASLLRAICWYASGWRQFLPTGNTLSTPSNQGTRWGCMQLSDHWHPDAFPSAMSDARANIRYAGNLLNWLYEQTGSWDRATVAFFGHDARAENAARRVRQYRERKPWELRLHQAPSNDSQAAHEAPASDDLYADLAI